MRSKEIKILFSIGLTIIVMIFIGKILLDRSQENRIEDITEKQYQSYSKLGIVYDGNESEIFDYLKENLNNDELELSVEGENSVTYKSIAGSI